MRDVAAPARARATARARDAIVRRVPAPSTRAATSAPCSLSARRILPCPRALPALCRLTLCYPPSQVVSTSRQLCIHVPHGRLRAHRPHGAAG
eukprot:1659631-Prymnesium_polylepis.1